MKGVRGKVVFVEFGNFNEIFGSICNELMDVFKCRFIVLLICWFKSEVIF